MFKGLLSYEMFLTFKSRGLKGYKLKPLNKLK